MTACRTCELTERRRTGAAPPWDAIISTDGWDVAHAFGTDVEGWIVLVARRHIETLADLTDHEAAELGPLIKQVSAALQTVVGCAKTYVAQFAEHPQHPHVHVHVIPRAPDLPATQIGPAIFSRVGLDDASVPDERMSEIAAELRRLLGVGSFGSG